MFFNYVRAAFRFVSLLLKLGKGYLIVLFLFPFLDARARALEVQKWSIGLLDCFGIVVQVEGAFNFRGPLLIVSNHISWLDVLVLHSIGYCRFVAKAEISRWPVFGFLSKKSGMFFIDRQKPRDALKVMHEMSDALLMGEVLAVFPEGTTSDGVSLLPFHTNLLQSAVIANSPIIPVCISYKDRASNEQSHAPAFVGEITIVQSVWTTLVANPISAQVKVGAVSYCQDRSRKEWSEELYKLISDLMVSPSPFANPGAWEALDTHSNFRFKTMH